MQIKKLRNEVSSAIAAGEVLERPASAIKELVENSVDSNASIIEVEIIQGGLESIRVRDNGIGIPAKDLNLALTRHATSKLFEISDLNSLKTLGFRGEALASIAAASRVNLSSRVRGDEGYFVEVLSGQILKQGSIGMSPGTSVSVEALFSTTPARLKYMKSSAVEAARIKQVVEGLALSNTSIGFSLKSDGKSILQHVVTTLQVSQIENVVVVLGHEAEKIKLDLEGEDVTYVMNPDYEQGIGTSISAGIRSVDKSARGALIMLGDMPVISAKTIDKLVNDFNRNSQAEIVVPTYEDQPGNPVLWSNIFFPQLSSLSGDRGGKPLIEKNTDVVSFCSVDSESVHLDVDNSDELERLRATVGP